MKQEKILNCKVPNCKSQGKPDTNGVRHFPLGFCNKHYLRFKRYGDVDKVSIVVGENRKKNTSYMCYHNMKKRCYDKKSTGFNLWGGRGITVCEEWLGAEGFSNFLKDMGERPSKNHSLERIENNGNYEPNNVKWATRHEQASNKRNNCVNVGVNFNKSNNSWVATISVENKRYKKTFKTQEEAINYRKHLEEIYLK